MEKRNWEFGPKRRAELTKAKMDKTFVPYPMEKLFRDVYFSKDSTLQRKLSFEEIKHIIEKGAVTTERLPKPISDVTLPTISMREESEFEKLRSKADEAGGEEKLPLLEHARYLQLHYMRGSERVNPLPSTEAKALAVLQIKVTRRGQENLTAQEKARLLSLVRKLGVQMTKETKTPAEMPAQRQKK